MGEADRLVTQTALAIRDADELEVAASVLDAALRRAKAEGMREAAKQARKGATLWSAGMKEREAAALDEFAVWLDARAAQIEEGE